MVKDTRKKIVNAVLRIASSDKTKGKLTLAEIANEAGISRQAIYQKHFKNTEEIFKYIHEEIDNKILSVFSENVLTDPNVSLIYERVATYLLPVIYDYREWLKILYNSEVDLKWRKYLFDNYYTPIITYLEENKINVSPLTTKQTVRISIDYTISIISVWLSEDVPMHPSIFSKVFLEVINKSPISLINRK
ncbi:TetR/AcrR family transcriptional regulator [Streptococcus saliviloxodontae]|uniref:AcrR family transcriptional regulator n=1 Tax=Streptococcus saliviloxodontae TaxID=1349416 RepID=A0ABS2PM18_9STRE|nr:TetR/AcrR family transcriptional regulator [Streptococcus saliviloxodontae]MBM7636040.1 AcrR family transcriptional regulator [Streptococcus saliviloxodontae]